MANSTDTTKKDAKILLMGLDNSGKTSIMLSLQRNTNLLTFCKLSPTKGVNIENLETDDYLMNVWDFGGQEKYRIEYLSHFKKYTSKVDKILYIIDVQDIKRYDPALDYLEKIIAQLNDMQISTELSVYIHKYDPGIKNKVGFEDIDEKINNLLIPRIKKITKNFDSQIFKSSIYTTFERELIT